MDSGEDIDKKFFSVGVGSPWQWFPKAAVAALSLGVSKARLDVAWSNLG